MIFKGAGVAIVTPFNGDNSINFSMLEELIEFQIANKTDAIIVCGSTGEISTMSNSEKLSVIEFTIKKVNGRVPVIAGIGCNDTTKVINFGKEVVKLGVDAVLAVCPYYNRPSQKGILIHFSNIAKNLDVPIILYNVPTRTGRNIEPETLLELSKIPNIVAIKECNFSQVAKIKRLCGDNIDIYCGNDEQTLPMLSLGACGVISVASNIIPLDIHNLCYEFFNNNIKESRNIQLRALELIDCLFIESSPVPIKTALCIIGKNVGKCRLPLYDMEQQNIDKLKNALCDYGFSI